MMKKFTAAGWKQVESKDNVTEDEIRALFDLIDRDRSGTLSLRVRLYLIPKLLLSCIKN